MKALCKALGVSRSSFYYKPKPKHSSKDLEEKVKESFEDSRKTYGTRRIKADLESQGITISRRRVGQIMQKFTTDLTYVRVKGKWCYACLVLDLYNREIVGWSVGPHKTADLVIEAMRSIPYDLTSEDTLLLGT
ncbi:IS3 family transposase [Streptococcus danieliae]|uniref:IS3 family transposase n=1 Tax=Streptococcus danieliae TaxID=747656 RepID=UPI00352A9E84